MKLDVELLRYLEADELRMLQAVEVGMRNHEYVPTRMLSSSESSHVPSACVAYHELAPRVVTHLTCAHARTHVHKHKHKHIDTLTLWHTYVFLLCVCR